MRRWSNGYDCGLPNQEVSRVSGFETFLFKRNEQRKRVALITFGDQNFAMRRNGESPGRRIFTMKYTKFIKTEIYEFLRDFSAFGNVLILIMVYLLVLEEKSFLFALIGLFLTLAICYTIKLFFHRKRPKHIGYTNILERIQSGAFPSVHSALIMYSGLTIISQTNKPWVDIFFAVAILIVGYSRYYLKKHYMVDIVVGYIIGFLIFLLIKSFI